MLSLPPGIQVFMAIDPVDMRKSETVKSNTLAPADPKLR